jgi:hypothetical protein
MTTYTKEQILRIGGNAWTHPATDEERLYLNDWPTLIGLEISRYNTGNICCSTLDGEGISNARARDILGTVTKVWWSDVDNQIHITAYTRGRYADRVPGWIRDGIADAVQRAAVEQNDDDDQDSNPATGIVTQLRAAGRTVREIAEMVGVSVSSIYRWARGICRPRPTNLAALVAIA